MMKKKVKQEKKPIYEDDEDINIAKKFGYTQDEDEDEDDPFY